MPYIKPDQRSALDSEIHALAVKINALSGGDTAQGAGLLNYSCTSLALEIVKLTGKPFNYATLAIVSGVFANVQSEFYRRKGVPYEDAKITENGDLDWD